MAGKRKGFFLGERDSDEWAVGFFFICGTVLERSPRRRVLVYYRNDPCGFLYVEQW